MFSVAPEAYTPNGLVKIVFLPPFRTGDQVVLKSGSPPLTVSGVDAENIIITWFAPDSNLQIAKLPALCFLPIEEGNA